MPKIYLINVGANSRHSSLARSPIFSNDSFRFIPFPTNDEIGHYDKRCLPFIKQNNNTEHTHYDPDWAHLTYGDDCANPRARSLLKVEEKDILLFWAMLWENTGDGWENFTGQRGWYLIGSLQVDEIAQGGHDLSQVSVRNRERASYNAHFASGKLNCTNERVFIGSLTHSARFDRAVDLEIGNPQGLAFLTFRASDGQKLRLDASPRWFSSLRSCRAVFDLQDREQRNRAQIVRDRILAKNAFDLLGGLGKGDGDAIKLFKKMSNSG